MSISDVLRDALHRILGYLYDEVGQPQDFYEAAWVQSELLPVLTAMNALRCELGRSPGLPPGDPLHCARCDQTYPDALQLLHHVAFGSAHLPDLTDVAMMRAVDRPDIEMVSRGDLIPIHEEVYDAAPGGAEVIEVEGFVVSMPSDCTTCRDWRTRWVAHIEREHPRPTAQG